MGAGLNHKKAAELLRRAKNIPSFEADLSAFRLRYGVPSLAQVTKDTLDEWLTEKYLTSIDAFYGSGPREEAQYIFDRIAFLRRYSLSVAGEGDAMDFILTDDIPPYTNFEIDPPYPDEEDIRGQRAIRIAVYEGASQDELIAFIKKEWKTIKSHLESENGPKQRIRQRPKHIEDEEALRLWESLPHKKGYREMQVTNQLGTKRSSDAVKRAVYREKKHRKGDI